MQLCPHTCGRCRAAQSQALADLHVRWLPLLWNNLPSHPHVAPAVTSPYHYRLDWEVWIHTTARLEAPALAGQPLPVPAFVSRLFSMILGGDTAAADLTGSGRGELFGGGKPPTGIKAQYMWFTFTGNSSDSAWWHAAPVANNPPLVWTAAGGDGWRSARALPLYRSHILATAATAAALALLVACDATLSQRQRVASGGSASVFLIAFVAMLLCPSVPVPLPLADAAAAAAAAVQRLLSQQVVAVPCVLHVSQRVTC